MEINMAYSYDFKDNVVYGADHINAIRASILTKGVIEETADSCRAVANENSIIVQKGQAIFEDGCRIEIDSDGVELGIIAGEVNYVYLNNNTLAGICEVMSSTKVPEGDYVLIAEVDAEGNLSDKRQFAQLKTADTQRYAETFSATLTMRDDMTSGDVIGTVVLPKSNCSMIDFNFGFENVFMQVKMFPKEDGKIICTYALNGQSILSDVLSFYALSNYRTFSFEINGNEMTVRVESVDNVSNSQHKISIIGVCIR